MFPSASSSGHACSQVHAGSATRARASVALCTCNGARYLGAQLDSIARQTRRPDRLVVVDDASNDDTVRIVERFAAGAPFTVRVEVNARRLGIRANFEKAAMLCGEGIVFLSDQDDVWREDKIERILNAFAAQPGVLLVHTDARVVDASLRDRGETLARALALTPRETGARGWQEQLEVLLRRNVVTGCTAAFDARLLQWALPFAAGWLHDEWLAVIAGALGGVAWIGEPLVQYRQHPHSQLGVLRHRGVAGLMRLIGGRRGVRSSLVPRFEQLLQRMERMRDVVDPAALDMVARALAFAGFRASLAPNRLARIAPIARQWRAGAYARYGRGWTTLAVDLIEAIPATPAGLRAGRHRS